MALERGGRGEKIREKLRVSFFGAGKIIFQNF
jgi:hypothetical protein